MAKKPLLSPLPSHLGDSISHWDYVVLHNQKDRTTKGYDGLRWSDFNGQIVGVSAAEQGGDIRAVFMPDDPLHAVWPSINVTSQPGGEDVAFYDLDGDGVVEAVICTEDGPRQLWVCHSPDNLNPHIGQAVWTKQSVVGSHGPSWMMGDMLEVNGRRAFVAGTKGGPSRISLWTWADSRDVASWHEQVIYTGHHWVMSLEARDMNGNGQQDVFVTDRWLGAFWLENPGILGAPWTFHQIALFNGAAMLSDWADLDGDGQDELLMPLMNPDQLLFAKQMSTDGLQWQVACINTIAEGIKGRGKQHNKSAALANIDGHKEVLVASVGRGVPLNGYRPLGNPFTDPWIQARASAYDSHHKLDMLKRVKLPNGETVFGTTQEWGWGMVLWHRTA